MSERCQWCGKLKDPLIKLFESCSCTIDWCARFKEMKVRALAAETIARRALVEGLAECERLRFELWMWKDEASEQRCNAADAAREEREDIVEFLCNDSDGTVGRFKAWNQAAERIRRGDHAKGGR